MGGEDRETGVAQRDEAHERVTVGAVAADLVRVSARGLVAVVAVGDQQLGSAQLLLRCGDRGPVGDAPEPMGRAVVIGQLAVRRPLELRRQRRPRIAVVEREDRREVGARRTRQQQPVLLRPWMRALVRTDPTAAVVLHAHAREQPAARAPFAVRSGVVLLERPQRRLRVGHDDAVVAPGLQGRGGVVVGVAAGAILRQVDRDDVVGRAGEQPLALLGIDHVVGRRDDRRQAPGAIEVVVERWQGRDIGHDGGGW